MRDFTLADGTPVWISPAEVDYFQASDDGTFVAFKDGRDISVHEDYHEVKAAFEAANN